MGCGGRTRHGVHGSLARPAAGASLRGGSSASGLADPGARAPPRGRGLAERLVVPGPCGASGRAGRVPGPRRPDVRDPLSGRERAQLARLRALARTRRVRRDGGLRHRARRPVRSLKARLILAFALVTLVPLAIAVAILTTRIQTMVRREAGEHLGQALEGVGAQVAEDGRRIAART